ncbi:uncharacterized protein LOC124162007 [Ischnura elegans]|uniref:uncharacterized protein LOC124162007 n=1 Tax=Ischnura elegans TaxID=197161 RepID=UPI001ED87F03|nr:uncharacterized protein LOC124162007 [Ischnura elegans]
MGFSTLAPVLILAFVCCHNVFCDRMGDILEASADFLEKAFSREVDFNSPDAFTKEWVDRAEEVMKKYVGKIKEIHNLDEHTLGKRGTDEQLTITRDYQGVNALTRIEELYDTTAQYPQDITLFYLLNDNGVRELYAATLILFEEDPDLGKTNKMVVFKLEGGRFKFLDKASVMGGVDIESFHIKGVPHIVCAEYDAGSSGRPLEGSVVYRLVDRKLENVQTLNTKYPSDISIWEDLNEVYMAVAISQVNQSTHISYEAESIIFRWLGEHFDLITTIKTYNARCVTPFKIGSTMYLAVANHMNNHDETDIDSEIFKYNLNEDRFVSHQKIRTHGAMDIKFFSSANKRKREHFIAVANSFEMGLDGERIYETGSIIYKYADDYFVPFQSILMNAATQWLHISGPRGELVLIAACGTGIRTFQYDGWRFVESEVQHSTNSFGPGISSMRSFTFGGGSVLAVANKNKQIGDADVFNLKFKPKYDLKEFHADLHNWCETMVEEIENEDLDGLLEKIRSLPKEDDETIYLEGDLVIEGGIINILKTDAIKIGDSILLDNDFIVELNNYAEVLNKVQHELDAVSTTIKNSMKTSGENHIQGSLKFEDLAMKCIDCKFEDAQISVLNGESVDRFFHNIVYLTDGLVTNGSLTFEEVTVESFQDSPQYFNGKAITNLVGRSKEMHMPGTLKIEGTATMLDGISVYGTIDELQFSPQTVLLSDEDQSLEGTISVLNASVKNLEAETINNVNASQLFHGTVKVGGYHDIHAPTVLEDVKVSSMRVLGNYNGIDLESLVNSTLKVCGDQALYGDWSFEKLKCENFILGLISGYNLEDDFVLINGHIYNIDGELDFRAPVKVKSLQVVNDFNGISVSDGAFDVLLLKPEETIAITGKKEFDSIFIESELTVSESFNGIETEEWNSVKTVHDPVYLKGDVEIHGKVSVNGNLVADDIRDESESYSLKKVFLHGIKLKDSVITGKSLILTGEVKVENVETNSINGLQMESWVIQNGGQDISAMKVFSDGMKVFQPINKIGLINGIDLAALDGDVLKTYGEQTVNGVKIFKNLEAPRFTAGECLFNDKWCNELLLNNEEQKVNGTAIIHGSVTVITDILVGNLTVGGKVAGYDLDFLIEDTLFDFDKSGEIKAEKTFKGSLTIDNLEVSGKVGVLDITNLLDMLYAKQFTNAEGSIIISQPTYIKYMEFTGCFNGISVEDFGSSWLLRTGLQIIEGEQVFESVIAKQNVALLSGEANDLNIEEMVDNAAMVNENCSFGDVKFGKVKTDSLQLDGLIQGLKFPEDIVFGDEETIEINGNKAFKSKLVVEGTMSVKGIEGLNSFEKMCELFKKDKPSDVALTVEGNINMDNEPSVKNVNNKNLDAIISEIWMADRDTELRGYKDFTNMIFNGEVEVEGLVDGINIKSLPQRYLSKSKEQIINGAAIFPRGIVFEKILTAPKAYVEGLVAGIDLVDFTSAVLLSGPDQTFTGRPKFEEIISGGELQLSSINGLDLKQDVMLWDREVNVIKGRFQVKNVHANELKLGEGAKVQGINIPLWSELAAMVNGDEENSIQIIKGSKILVNAEFMSNLRVDGMINQLKFDAEHIMLLDEEQTVTGKKTFAKKQPPHEGPSFSAHNIYIEGKINGIDMKEFLSGLVHRNEDIVFAVPKTFTNSIVADNVAIKGLYHGVNISEISPELFNDTYLRVIPNFDVLLSSSKMLKESLERRAIYVSHYEMVQDMEKGMILPLSYDINEPIIAILNKENDSNTIDMYKWYSKAQLLVKGETEVLSDNFTYAASLQCLSTYYVYIEFYNESKWNIQKEDKNQGGVGGYFLEHSTKNGFIKSNYIETAGTSSVVPLMVPFQNSCCFFLAQWFGVYSPVLCRRGSLDQMVVFQKIPANRITQASSGFVEKLPYLAYIMDAEDIPEKGASKLHVWIYASQTKQFELLQEIMIEGAISVASIEHHEVSYLAVSAAGMPNAVSPGMIKIYRVHPGLRKFVSWVNLDVTLPLEVKFSLLPSDELVLYVSTKNPSKPFIVYIYKGVAGFEELTYAAHAPTLSQITTFNVGTWNSFVALDGVGGTKLLQPVFKGV